MKQIFLLSNNVKAMENKEQLFLIKMQIVGFTKT